MKNLFIIILSIYSISTFAQSKTTTKENRDDVVRVECQKFTERLLKKTLFAKRK